MNSAAEVKHAQNDGRWVYTSAIPKFHGDSNKIRAVSGCIHAGWEDAPEFATAEEFYAWAKAECARRNVLEAAATDMLAVLKPIADELGFAEWASPEAAESILSDLIRKWHGPARAAIAKATQPAA